MKRPILKKKINLIIIGSGGHALSCIDVINSTQEFDIMGYIDNSKNKNFPSKYKYYGSDEDLKLIRKEIENAFIAVGQIKDFKNRLNIYKLLKKYNFTLPKILASSSYVSDDVLIGEGTIVMHNCFINSGTIIGKNCIINTGALIEHNVEIKDHNHISTSVVINGGVKIGSKNFIGSNSTLNNDIHLGDEMVIPSASRITKNNKKKYEK